MSENILQTSLSVHELVESGSLSGFAVLEVDLRKLDLTNRNLSDIAFRRVCLESVVAHGATCRDVRFEASRLRGLNFTRGLLTGLRFMNCEAHEMSFESSYVVGMQSYDTPMTNAKMARARLDDCVFQSTDLYGVNFESALLMHCRFSDPRMENANINRANFERAILIDVDLRGANLHGANFKDALLVNVDLRDTNLVRTELDGVSLVACDTSGSVR